MKRTRDQAMRDPNLLGGPWVVDRVRIVRDRNQARRRIRGSILRNSDLSARYDSARDIVKQCSDVRAPMAARRAYKEGLDVRVLDHYEAVGQVLGSHVAWLRKSRLS